MSDQGDKIIHLAREVLRNGHLSEPDAFLEEEKTEAKGLSIKAAALAALIAAVGSASLTHLIEETRRPINRYERVEIDALVFYAAQREATTEDRVRSDVQSALSLTSMNEISVYDYRRVREYLWQRIQG